MSNDFLNTIDKNNFNYSKYDFKMTDTKSVLLNEDKYV